MALPEKDFFTLDEVVHRWRHAGIDKTTLLKLATDDLLVFSLYIRDIGSHVSTRETPEGTVTTDHTIAFSFRDPSRARPPIQYLKAEDARRILEARPNEKIRIPGHYSLPSRTKESGLGYANSAPLLDHSDLIVSKIERDRFEKQHKIPLRPPGRTRVWHWLSDQSNQRVLTMLSGWMVAVATGLWSVWLWHQK